MKAKNDHCMKNSYSISLVIPMFNEKESIESTIRSAVSFLNNCNPDSEIIVVDDGSTDSSFSLVSALGRENSLIKCVRFNENKGIGRALRAGFNQAKNDLILYTDSDWPVDDEILKQAFDLLFREKADLVVGHRLGKRKLFYRKVYSFFYNLFVRIIFGLKIKDVNCPLKIIYRKVIKDIVLKSDGPFIDVELLVRSRNKGYEIAELPYLNMPRKLGHSKFNSFSGVTKALKSTLKEMLKITPELIFK